MSPCGQDGHFVVVGIGVLGRRGLLSATSIMHSSLVQPSSSLTEVAVYIDMYRQRRVKLMVGCWLSSDGRPLIRQQRQKLQDKYIEPRLCAKLVTRMIASEQGDEVYTC